MVGPSRYAGISRGVRAESDVIGDYDLPVGRGHKVSRRFHSRRRWHGHNVRRRSEAYWRPKGSNLVMVDGNLVEPVASNLSERKRVKNKRRNGLVKYRRQQRRFNDWHKDEEYVKLGPWNQQRNYQHPMWDAKRHGFWQVKQILQPKAVHPKPRKKRVKKLQYDFDFEAKKLPQISYKLSDSEFAFFNKLFGEHENGLLAHDHGLAAAVRYEAQYEAEKWLLERKYFIFDMWGSARLPHDNKHSAMPIVTAHDSIRHRPNKVCDCQPYNCTHVDGKVAPFVVDVLYYMKPSDIEFFVNKYGALFTLHHTLNNTVGSELCGTYTYYKMKDSKVHVDVGTGVAKHSYEHGDLSWIYKTGYTFELIRTFGPMQFGMFVKPDSGVKMLQPRDEVMINVGTIAREFMFGKMVTPATERDLISRMKRADTNEDLARLKKIYPDKWYELKLDIMGNTLISRTKEITYAKAIKESASSIIDVNKFIDEKFTPKVSWCQRFKRLVIGTTATVIVSGGGIMYWMTMNPMAVWGNLFCPDVCIHTDQDLSPNVHPIREPQVYVTGSSKILRKLAGGATYFREPHIHLNYENECGCRAIENRTRGLLVLSYVEDRKPFTFASCEGNIAHGLRLRFLRTLPAIVADAWEKMETELDGVLFEFKKAPFISHKGFYHKWVGKFPLAKQARMNRALNDPEDEKLFASSICCKFEAGFVKEPLKPRVFFPKSDANLVRNGPVMNLIKNKLIRLFDGNKTPFIFGPGNTPYSLGHKFGRAIDKYLPGVDFTCVELDLSMCETTMRGPMLIVESMVYKAMGISRRDIEFLLDHTVSYGRSVKGNLSWSMPFCRESGTANTTGGNTCVFATFLWSFMRYFKIPFVCLIGGDDACVYLARTHQVRFRMVVDEICRTGLKPEALYHQYYFQGRFFAGRMMRVRLLLTSEHVYAHVPLIGRCIAKNLVCKYSYGQRYDCWLRDVTIGRQFDWEHVPCLSVINRSIRAQYKHVLGKNTMEIPYRDIKTHRLTFGLSDALYDQIAMVYNLEADDIRALEVYLNRHFNGEWIGKALKSEILDIMVEIDLK